MGDIVDIPVFSSGTPTLSQLQQSGLLVFTYKHWEISVNVYCAASKPGVKMTCGPYGTGSPRPLALAFASLDSDTIIYTVNDTNSGVLVEPVSLSNVDYTGSTDISTNEAYYQLYMAGRGFRWGATYTDLAFVYSPFDDIADCRLALVPEFIVGGSITYRLTNSTVPSAPTNAIIGDTVTITPEFTSGYGIVNPTSDVYVTCNGVVIPSTYSNGVLTFTMPNPS